MDRVEEIAKILFFIFAAVDVVAVIFWIVNSRRPYEIWMSKHASQADIERQVQKFRQKFPRASTKVMFFEREEFYERRENETGRINGDANG
jgi:hypothetical protein